MARKKKGREISGWLILDKPYELGSTKAVSIIKKLYDAKKAGHAGTLDPLATGLLPIALGEATKTAAYITEGKKGYRFTIGWGQQTNTDDGEGEIINSSKNRPSENEVNDILKNFTGAIEQVPPQFSAIKIDGKRAYAEARAGNELKLQPRQVEITKLEIITHEKDQTVLQAECGKGTYIRSLARDMGMQLNCYGYVKNLHRTFVEPFAEKDSVQLEKLQQLEGNYKELDSFLLPPLRAMCSHKNFTVDNEGARRIRLGNKILLRDIALNNQTEICAIYENALLAIGETKQGEFQPKKVLAKHGQ